MQNILKKKYKGAAFSYETSKINKIIIKRQ